MIYGEISYRPVECVKTNSGKVFFVGHAPCAEYPWLVEHDGKKKPYKTRDAAYLCLYCMQRPRRPTTCPVTATSRN